LWGEVGVRSRFVFEKGCGLELFWGLY